MIKVPTLVIDKNKIDRNINKMISLCKKWDMDFRPHFKTHQSTEIAKWFLVKGIEKCTVSSINMAIYFANHGWKDICIAIPVNILEIDEINDLASKVKLSLIIDHEATAEYLKTHLQNKVSAFIEIDTGYGRSGVHYSNKKQLEHLISIIESSSDIDFEGFLSHTGNSYSVENMEKGADLFDESRKIMLQLKDSLLSRFSDLKISLGDTPSSTYAKDFTGIDEWRPGNFVFYDLMQYAQGVCTAKEIGLIVRCPIIGIYKERKEIVIYGGGVHLSKEPMIYNGNKIYGWLKVHEEVGDDELLGFPVISLSQEHGIISATDDFLSQLSIGDLVDIVPVHSCMAADLYPSYFSDGGISNEKYRSNS